ncbi:hypothetical protein KC669_03670 [Candidatus Dojkabacteria bacterium]|uniref:Uncharacterized protein n=1 Tax=Candidatus Dojkabacteria bacterium TaxID=2099670 RepID=A0A955LBE6_9BACT|nr:hypothetical protein [Candidatus Dojkabacteria bacterium]
MNIYSHIEDYELLEHEAAPESHIKAFYSDQDSLVPVTQIAEYNSKDLLVSRNHRMCTGLFVIGTSYGEKCIYLDHIFPKKFGYQRSINSLERAFDLINYSFIFYQSSNYFEDYDQFQQAHNEYSDAYATLANKFCELSLECLEIPIRLPEDSIGLYTLIIGEGIVSVWDQGYCKPVYCISIDELIEVADILKKSPFRKEEGDLEH